MIVFDADHISLLQHRDSPKAEILRVQLDRAKQLLATSDLPLAAVADKSGFRSVTYFAEIVRKRLGTTPGNYRKRFKMPESRKT